MTTKERKTKMGLDMYLSVRRSLCLKKGKLTVNLDDKRGYADGLAWDDFGVSNRITFEQNVCYWRKANSVHRWFVENCSSDGKTDDCEPCNVSVESLRDLHNICKRIVYMVSERKTCLKLNPKIKKMLAENEKTKDEKYDTYFKFDKNNLPRMLNSHIGFYDLNNKSLLEHFKDMLPTQDGFFFGTTEYGGSYIGDVVKTVLMLDRLFARIDEFDKNKSDYELIYHASW